MIRTQRIANFQRSAKPWCLALALGLGLLGPGCAARRPVDLGRVVGEAWRQRLAEPEPTAYAAHLPLFRRPNALPSTTLFEKYRGNPVLRIPDPPAFDAGHGEYPSVIGADDRLWLFYSAYGKKNRWSIAAATSIDGIDWQKLGEVLEPDSTASMWDSETLAFPCVLYDAAAPDEERFRMYYAGKRDRFYDAIGMATSPDGLCWARRGPVLRTGSPGDADGGQMVDPSVIRFGNGYRMYYNASRSKIGGMAICLALSQDGIKWVKYPDNPIYEIPRPTENQLYTADVIEVDGRFLLFEASAAEGKQFDIYATVSGDGICFDPATRRRVLRASRDQTWDQRMVYGMDVVAGDGELLMWFNGIHRSSVTRGGQIGLARAALDDVLGLLGGPAPRCDEAPRLSLER